MRVCILPLILLYLDDVDLQHVWIVVVCRDEVVKCHPVIVYVSGFVSVSTLVACVRILRILCEMIRSRPA